jgi:hypothetical protein
VRAVSALSTASTAEADRQEAAALQAEALKKNASGGSTTVAEVHKSAADVEAAPDAGSEGEEFGSHKPLPVYEVHNPGESQS